MSLKKLGSVKAVSNIIVTSADLAADVTGVLPTANGGTGTGAPTTGQLLKGAAGNVWSNFAIGTAFQSIRINAAGTDLEYFDDNVIKRLTADQSAITSTTGVAVSSPLQQSAAVNEEWYIEWIIGVTYGTVAATGVIKLASTAGTSTGYWTMITSVNGTNPQLATGETAKIFQSLDYATTFSGAGFGSLGSTTAVTNLIISARFKQTVSTGTMQVLLGSSVSTVTPKLQSQMIARRIA